LARPGLGCFVLSVVIVVGAHQTRAVSPADFDLPDAAVEDVSQRTERTKSFVLPDGSQVAISRGRPLHYRDSVNGPWKDIQLRFHQGAGASWIADEGPVAVVVDAAGIAIGPRDRSAGLRWMVPNPTVSGTTISATLAGVDWQWSLTPTGLKMSSAPIAGPLGRRTVTFPFGRFGAAQSLAFAANGEVAMGDFRFLRPVLIGADGVVYPTCAWKTVGGGSLTLMCDDRSLPPEAYPYIVDPPPRTPPAAAST